MKVIGGNEMSIKEVCERIDDLATNLGGWSGIDDSDKNILTSCLKTLSGDIKRRGLSHEHPYADFGCAGVATVHHYEVRATVAGRCDIMATFTDPKRAMEYAEHLALELYEFHYGNEEGESEGGEA